MARRGMLALALVASSALVALPTSAPAAATAHPVRIMVVGDSVTQGSAGDWTWRYRLWRHLRHDRVPVDLVGPRRDLYDNVDATQGSTAYADPAFDTDHAARWGTSFATMDTPVDDLVRQYRPDVVVEALGVNDLLAGASVDVLDQRVRDFVAAARTARPGVDVVLTGLSQAWLDGVAAYDAGLPGLAADLDTPASRVVVAAAPADYQRDTDTWDYLHPSASGEVKIAAGVADALAGLGIGRPYPRPLPVVPLGLRMPPRLTATARDGAVDLRWTSPPGTTQVYVWVREGDGPWVCCDNTADVDRESFAVTGLTDGTRYRFRVQAYKGSIAAQHRYSAVVGLVPQPPPAAVTGLRARSASGGTLALRWDASAGATSYQVRWRAAGSQTWSSRRVDGSAATLSGLARGRDYEVSVRGRAGDAAGAWCDPVVATTLR